MKRKWYYLLQRTQIILCACVCARVCVCVCVCVAGGGKDSVKTIFYNCFALRALFSQEVVSSSPELILKVLSLIIL